MNEFLTYSGAVDHNGEIFQALWKYRLNYCAEVAFCKEQRVKQASSA